MEGYGIININNMKFMMYLSQSSALSDAAQKAGISRSHANRLVNEWVRRGWLEIAPRKERRYEFRREGYEVLGAVVLMLKAVGEL